MKNLNAEDLLDRYNAGQVSQEERAIVETWYLHQNTGERVPDAQQLLDDHFFIKDALLNHVQQKPVQRLWPRITAVASVILVLGTGIFFYRTTRTPHSDFQKELSGILPGKNTAILTLANGKTIVLSDKKSGLVIDDNAFTYTDGSKLESQGIPEPLKSLTINTPRGGTYAVYLPDGTKVWLNAASTLKFPAHFTGLKERKVELTGEAYFAVKHDAKQPFRVFSAGQTVEDIGTEFNINAYPDEPATKTTLIEGSASVTSLRGGTTKQLSPNQQVSLLNGTLNISSVNTEDIIAWKNGLFKFENTDIKTLMRQISRWYNIDIAYEGNLKAYKFYGQIERSYTLAEVLKVLELEHVHIRIETLTNNKKKLIVLP